VDLHIKLKKTDRAASYGPTVRTLLTEAFQSQQKDAFRESCKQRLLTTLMKYYDFKKAVVVEEYFSLKG